MTKEPPPVFLQGKVIGGQKIANTFGVATANIQVFESKLEEEGVYIVECSILGNQEIMEGLMHYGKRKTVDNKFSVEVHLLNFSQDIYGEILEVRILEKLRDVQKFPSVEELFKQIRQDVVRTKKYFLRRKIKNIWKDLSVESREILAKNALAKVSQLDSFLNATNVYIYAPKHDEIDFVQELCEKFPDKKYFFPKMIDREIIFFHGIYTDLKKGKWGILEPDSNWEVATEKPDLIFVPAVAGNLAGNRLGNGGGFYDKFLAKNSAKKICVLPKFAVLDDIPVEEHDVKIDKVVII